MPERYTLTDAARFNIARGQRAPVETASGVEDLRWGLLAPWRGHGGKRGPMIHDAPVDAIATTPLLRNARAKRRCLVLADGWYAWRGKQPYWIHAPHRAAFAGLVATHADDRIASFAIVTVPAAGVVAALGEPTMPALADARWLADDLLAPELAGWRADRVSNHVDDPAHDDPACVALLPQTELF
ncbi:MAG: SOS response-associated peptidase family protein [Acidobacteriota bacterium]